MKRLKLGITLIFMVWFIGRIGGLQANIDHIYNKVNDTTREAVHEMVQPENIANPFGKVNDSIKLSMVSIESFQ